MTANRAMALRVVWGTRIDDDTPGGDARELLEMLGLIAPDGDEILPDTTTAGRLLDVTGRPVATAPPPSRRPSAALKPTRGGGKGRAPKPIEHGTDYGYLQHKRKHEPIPADDACGCQAAHDALLVRHRKASPAVPDPLTGHRPTVAETVPGLVIAHDEPVSDPLPPAKPDPAPEPPPAAPEPAAPTTADRQPPSDRMPCVVRPILEPRNPVDPAPTHRAYGDLAARARINWRGTVSKAEVLPTPAPLDVDAWLARAQESTRPAVRRRATKALTCLMQLRCALDELARAERGGVR